jgi:MFS family permease
VAQLWNTFYLCATDARQFRRVGGQVVNEVRQRALAVELLAAPDYRRYWLSSTSFAVGIWGFLVSMGYSAKELTDSPLLVALVSVAYFMPMFVLALPSGVLADIADRKKTVISCRAGCAVVATVLAGLSAVGHLTYPALLALCFLVGASVVLEVAARQAYVTQVVRPDQVVGAMALGSVQGGIARVIGPLIAGALIASAGQASGYLFFAVANAYCAWVFLGIKASGVPPRAAGRPMRELVEGLAYLRGHADAYAIVGISVLTGVVGWLYVALLPSINRDVLDGGAVQLAVLSAAIGIGSVPPSILLAVRRGPPWREGLLFLLSTVAWGIAVVVYALTSNVVVACLALAVTGAGNGLQQIVLRTLLLRITEPAYHGRVMGTLMLSWGANVAGTLAGGGLAERFGVPTVIAWSGVLIVVVPLVTVLRRPGLLRL